MGIFSGLLNALGGGDLGGLASKAMDIGGKLFNRKEGESFGDALIGQLPAIASGLGSAAKQFGGFIPGIGGIVSKIGGMVEDGAKEFETPQISNGENEFPYSSWEDVPDKYKTYDGLMKVVQNAEGSGAQGSNPVLNAIRRIAPLSSDGESLNLIIEAANSLHSKDMYESEEEYNDALNKQQNAERKLREYLGTQRNDINSPMEMLKHASNNMPVMFGRQYNANGNYRPNSNVDHPLVSNGSSSSNWRSFNRKPMAQPHQPTLHELNSNNMYASNLPSEMLINSKTGQTKEDLGPVSFKRGFIR